LQPVTKRSKPLVLAIFVFGHFGRTRSHLTRQRAPRRRRRVRGSTERIIFVHIRRHIHRSHARAIPQVPRSSSRVRKRLPPLHREDAPRRANAIAERLDSFDAPPGNVFFERLPPEVTASTPRVRFCGDDARLRSNHRDVTSKLGAGGRALHARAHAARASTRGARDVRRK